MSILLGEHSYMTETRQSSRKRGSHAKPSRSLLDKSAFNVVRVAGAAQSDPVRGQQIPFGSVLVDISEAAHIQASATADPGLQPLYL